MKNNLEKVRIAALSDIHVKEDSQAAYQELLRDISKEADVLILGGDLTHHGLPKEAEVLARELNFCSIPIVGVLGNHDFETGHEHEVKTILSERMHLLEGNPTEIEGIGFAGVKGFAGGFGNQMLSPFGEEMIKRFVKEAVNESLDLEKSLNDLQTRHKVVVMHYSPIPDTCVGEAVEIFPFLGCSRLAEPVDLLGVTVVFHGHAHYGSPEGKTPKGIPVFNVAYPLMQTVSPQKPYKIVELPIDHSSTIDHTKRHKTNKLYSNI